MTLDEIFAKVEVFVHAAEAKALDLTEKGADVFQSLTNWLRAAGAKSAVMSAAPGATEKWEALGDQLAACYPHEAPAAPPTAKGAAAFGPLAQMLIQLVLAVIAQLGKKTP